MRPTTELRPADSVPTRDLVDAMNLAYRNYYRPLHLTPDGFTAMAFREAVALDQSIVAVDGGQVVGTALLGVREPRGWIGGVGVVPEFRQQGIARAMTEYLLQQARLLGLETVQLEVITLNEVAYRLYETLGFERQRRLLLLARQPNPRPLRTDEPLPPCEARPPDEALNVLADLDHVRRSWSRDADELTSLVDWFEALVALDPETGNPSGVCLFSAHPFQVGLITLAGATGTGIALLNKLHAAHPEATVSYFNVPDNDPMFEELQRVGYQESLAQYEMLRRL